VSDERCAVCGRRARRRFCSDACRSRAYRRRKAGRPENYRASGAKRGRVPLNSESATERGNALLSTWFVTFREEVERVHREVVLLRAESSALRAENAALRAEVERLRGRAG
jgi:hypothetical protein